MYKVLLIDDNRAIKYELKRYPFWAKYGFEIADEASDGKEGFDKFYKDNFELVLVDIKMPQISGLQFLENLRENGSNACVVIMSSHSDFEHAKQALRLGAFDFLSKPILESSLDEMLCNAKANIDEKLKLQESQSLKDKTLQESLKVAYSPENDVILFDLLLTDPKNGLSLARENAGTISIFFQDDQFKTSTILNNSLYNIYKMLTTKMPWLKNMHELETVPQINFQIIKNCDMIIEIYVKNLEKIVYILKELYLNTKDPIIKRICEYVISFTDSKTTIEELSLSLEYSTKYIGKIFKEKTGEGLVDFITRIKMARAKALLLSGKYKTYEISDLLGYKKPDYFTLLFKKKYGITPQEFKQTPSPIKDSR